MSTPINVLEVFQKFFWLASGIDTWLKKKEKPIENVKKRLYEPTVQIILYIYMYFPEAKYNHGKSWVRRTLRTVVFLFLQRDSI